MVERPALGCQARSIKATDTIPPIAYPTAQPLTDPSTPDLPCAILSNTSLLAGRAPMNSYLILKNLHMTLAAISIAGFVFRGVLVLRDSAWIQHRLLKVVPHVVDTLFLLSGIVLAVMLHQYPGTHHWLTAKVVGLLVYIVLGTLGLKRAPSKLSKVVCMVLAVAVFIWIVGIALHRHPLAWLA